MTINDLVSTLAERNFSTTEERNSALLDMAKRAQSIAYLLVAAHLETWKPCSCGKIQGARYPTTSGHADSCAGFVVASIREMGADTKEFDAGSRAAWEQATPEQRKNWDRDGGAPDNKNLAEARLALWQSEVLAKGILQTRFQDFHDPRHPANIWWQKHGKYMMSGGGARHWLWACRGWIACEQLAAGVEVSGDSLHESGRNSPVIDKSTDAADKLAEARLALELVEERGLHVSGEMGPYWLVVDRGAFGNLQFVLFGGAAPSPEPLRSLRDLIRAAAAEIGYRATGDDFGMVEAEAIILEKLGLK